MNHAGLKTSPRLQRLHRFLSDGAEHSTMDCVMGAHVCAVNAAISELRANGAEIECRQTVDDNRTRVFLYRMTRRAEDGQVQPRAKAAA